MKSTLYRITPAGILVLVLLFSTPLGQAKTGHAQADTEWSEPINLSHSGASRDPSIVVDNEGVIHVIWVDEVDGYKYVYSTDGVNWSEPVTVDFPFDPETDSRPKMIADSSGSIHIFWTRSAVSEADETDEQITSVNLMYARAGANFLSQPLSWAAMDKLADSVLDFDVTADSRSSIHLSFVEAQGIGGSPAGIFYRRFDDRVWTPPISLYSSQYFRTLTLEDSHVRVASTGGGASADVYVAWDDRTVKRIYLTKSIDGGKNWSEAAELHGPGEATGLSLPYNVNVDVTGQNVLLSWQLGQPGSLCSQYSQWSVDGAETFSDPRRVSEESLPCPSSGSFVGTNPGYSMMLLDLFGDFSLLAWNGTDWSPLQSQPEMTTFSNSLTLDSVIFGCRQTISHSEIIYVVGCDEVAGDIWFRYRPLGSLNDWFPPAAAWTGPNRVSVVSQEISSSAAITGVESGPHIFWAQHGTEADENESSTLQYVRWENGDWSNPVNILNGLAGVSSHLSAATDPQGGVLLAWVTGVNGDIYFTRANGDTAYLASEWLPPVLIPSLSELNTTPDMVTDSSNRIALVYSVPYNENRGIYLVQSTDLGRTWSAPVLVFDAVAENWDSVVEPEIELSADGRLHLLFTRISLREAGPETSLYYSHSQDGGSTWTTPEAINNGGVQWSEIVHTGSNVLYRLWQEQNGDLYETFSGESRDGGSSWSSPLKVSSGSGSAVRSSLARDADGRLYLAQSRITGDEMVVEEILWDGARWTIQELNGFALDGNLDRDYVASSLAPDGTLHFLVSIDYAASDAVTENEVLGYRRLVESTSALQNPPSVLIPTPVLAQATFPAELLSLTPTQPPPLGIIDEAANARTRNTIGFALIAGVILLTLLILRPRRKSGK